MTTLEEVKKIAKENEMTFIKINRVPLHIKELFSQIAEQEFCNDYGLFLREILVQYLEYQKVKECLLDKEYLNLIINSKIQNEKKETSIKKRKTFGDKIEELKGGKK